MKNFSPSQVEWRKEFEREEGEAKGKWDGSWEKKREEGQSGEEGSPSIHGHSSKSTKS